MPVILQFVVNRAIPQPKLKTAVATHCVHCYLPLVAANEGSFRADAKKKHECSESLLAKQPATPTPYN